tara:strand:+ start:583 stop:876 length:294 start_codon:yes stop_codon:yes gene_type:complete
MSLWGKTDDTSGEPKFTSHHEGMDSSNFTVYGVDKTEQSVANAASGVARKFAPAHAGYVGITSYTDMHGNLRVKTEVLVATSSITGDASDDQLLPDS